MNTILKTAILFFDVQEIAFFGRIYEPYINQKTGKIRILRVE